MKPVSVLSYLVNMYADQYGYKVDLLEIEEKEGAKSA